MSDERVLVIEDDLALRRGLADNLQFVGYDVRTAADGETGLQAALKERPDLIVLDIMLPRVNGYEICRRLREEGLEMPIVMLTAKGQESDIVLGLDLGADDYVTKPFGIRELLARVKALLRRRHLADGETHAFGRFRLDLAARRLTAEDREVPLTPKELAVLALLVQQAGRALTRDAILRAVWGQSVFVTTRSVDRCVNTLRGKIEADPRHPLYIQTVRQIGYRFQFPDDSAEAPPPPEAPSPPEKPGAR